MVDGTKVRLGLGAVVISVLALAGCGGGNGSTGDSSGEIGTDPISLPAKIDGFTELVQAVEAKDGSAKAVKSQKENQEAMAAKTATAYEKAYGGAAAAYRASADDELMKLPYVIAVRTEAPGMTIGPVVIPRFLGLAKPEREVQTVGEVECQIASSPVSAGTPPDPSGELTTNCQRSGSGLTVFVGSSGFEGPSGLQSMVAFTDAAWEAVDGE